MMKLLDKTRTILLLALTMLWTNASSQTQRTWEQLLANVMTADDMEAGTWEDTYEMLCQLEQDPINLNTATREDLEQLPFLTAQQVEGIMDYLYHYAPMKSLNELRMIRQLDAIQRELLCHFCYVDEELTENTFPKIRNILKYGRHELTADFRVPFYERKGDSNGYRGHPYRHATRYMFKYGDYVKWGMVGAQDAGEPFFAGDNKVGYDFYSYYLQVKHWGKVENAVVGKYKLSAGMGLVLNNSFSLGKLAMLQQLGRSTSMVRPHASRSPSDYFRGAAATVRLSPRWLLTAFLSYRPLDATLNADGTARTLLTDGYHRTDTEMAKKHNTHAVDAGSHIAYKQGGLHVGLTAVYTHLDRQLQPDTSPLYRRHAARGNDFINVSTDYGFTHPRFSLNGETAINRLGAIATINSMSATISEGLSLMLLQRFYSYRYTALYARSISEGGRVQNENGIYIGLTWTPSPSWRLQAYTDYAYFAWARYHTDQSSESWDHLLTATYSSGAWRLSGRYRLHEKEHRGRVAIGRSLGTVTCTTQADAVTNGSDRGYMVSETVSGQWRNIKINGHAAFFHTNSYAARLYAYEHSPRHAFSFPAFYGEGVRLALMVQANIGRRLTLTAKPGYTHYTDRSTIGSDLQTINGSSQTDLDLQALWKF